MGRLEKIVVLTVLFLVAVVLGVALNSDGSSAASGSRGAAAEPEKKLAGDLDGLGGTLSAPMTDDPSTPGPKQPADGLSGGTPVPPTPQPEGPKPVPTQPQPPAPTPYILTLDGLVPTEAPDMMFYTWQAGDTLAAIAQRYYGSREKVARLQKANEGQSDASLKPGDRLWVQVAATTVDGPVDQVGTFYLVKKGDVLSGISQKFYGTAKKWQKILDANKDILSSPDRLQPGMKLRIPE